MVKLRFNNRSCNTWLECYHSNQGSPGQMMHWMITQHPPNSRPPPDWHVFRQYPDLFAIRVKYVVNELRAM